MKRPSSTRQGNSIILALTLLALIGTVLLGDLDGLGHRLRQSSARQSRVQAREYALGAACLPAGTTITIGAWTIRHLPGIVTDRRIAAGPAGTYQIDVDHDTGQTVESWKGISLSPDRDLP